MTSSVTVKDLAQHAAVSVGTVSRVLNNQGGVNADKKHRVLQAVSELGYGGTNAGATSQSRPIKEIGFFYRSSLDNLVDEKTVVIQPYWSHILHGAELEARRSRLKLSYRILNEPIKSERQFITQIQGMQLDGILLVGPSEEEVVRLLHSTKIPLVLVDNYIPGVPVDTVSCDAQDGARQAVSYLFEQGHRQIAFLCGPVMPGGPRITGRISSGDRRITGYCVAFLDHGQAVDYTLFEPTDFSIPGGYEACKKLIQRGSKFSAIFCINDMVAIGAMKALNEAGLRVPQDVSIVGYDDIDLAEHLTPALTTIRVNKEAIGMAGVKTLLSRSVDPQAANINIILDVSLVKRDSVQTISA